METKNDILNLKDIKQLVNTFYEKVRKDELLGPVFNERIGTRWPEHLEKMYRFWQTVLLVEHTYFGSPFLPHVNLPLGQHHFDRWIMLFYQSLDTLFSGNKAEEAKWRAQKMAEMFMYKIAYHQKKRTKPRL